MYVPTSPAHRPGLTESTDRDDQLWPAGRHVPQTSGEPSRGIAEWIGDGTESVDNTDIVLWHTWGLTHFPAPEDFPVMPAEPMSLLLRPRNFFTSNPVMDVPPSFCSTPSQVAAGNKGVRDATDAVSRLAFGAPVAGAEEAGAPGVDATGGSCCSNGTNGVNGTH